MRTSIQRTVLYRACPLSTCPTSWATTQYSSSSSSILRVALLSTMKGSFTPNAPALKKGLFATNTSGVKGLSSTSTTRSRMFFTFVNWVGVTFTALETWRSRMERSVVPPTSIFASSSRPLT